MRQLDERSRSGTSPRNRQDGQVYVDLVDQWEQVAHGELVGPDGARYRRRSTKSKRRLGDELVAAGAPLMLHYWAGGQLEWFEGADADARWKQVRGAVTSQEPRPSGEVVWTAGRWEDLDGRAVLFLTGHC
jgi:hypothetical protein